MASSFYGSKKKSDRNESSNSEEESASVNYEDTSDDEYIHSETVSNSSSENSLNDEIESQSNEEEEDNEEENLNEDISSPDAEWMKVTRKARQHGFTGTEELCVRAHPSSTANQIWPIDLYKQIITDDIINLIVQETNRYAEQKISSVTVTRSKLRQWVPMNKGEIEKFIGLIIYMGLVPLPDIQIYWSKSRIYRNELVPSTMSRDRFLLLLQMLHFCNNEEPNVGKDLKIRKLVDMILVQYQSIYKSDSDEHCLQEAEGQKRKTRKRCRGCYEMLARNESSKVAKINSKKVSTYCDSCDGSPYLCLSCFNLKHNK